MIFFFFSVTKYPQDFLLQWHKSNIWEMIKPNLYGIKGNETRFKQRPTKRLRKISTKTKLEPTKSHSNKPKIPKTNQREKKGERPTNRRPNQKPRPTHCTSWRALANPNQKLQTELRSMRSKRRYPKKMPDFRFLSFVC